MIVDDHSRDDTIGVVEQLTRADPRVRGVRLSRNSGSHLAIACGLHHARGEAAVMMAADLQDPPETIEALVAEWRKGAQIVWASRRVQPGEAAHAGFAALYYWIMRRVVGLTAMPARGADFFLIDRTAIDAFRRCDERNVSVLALVTWLGFRQAHVEYDKQPRAAGRSGWTLGRKVALVADSVTAFTALPIRVCGMLGAALVVAGLAGAVYGMAARGLGPLAARGLDHRARGPAARRAGRPGRVPLAGSRGRAAPPGVFRRARGGYKINGFFDIATQDTRH